MHIGQIVFAQLMELLPLYEFQKCVRRYQGNYRIKNFSCLDQFLCLELFPWAKFRKAKGAVKLHTLLNLRGSIPEFIHITEGRVHDVNIMDLFIIKLFF